MKTVAALFVRKDSVYKAMAQVDAWDKERDARLWPGGCAVVAHPPCAQWGTLRHMARVNPAEKLLALTALELVDVWGGVLEHPIRSKLWEHTVGRVGWLLPVDQHWFGHPAQKRTLLYVNGVERRGIPIMPIALDYVRLCDERTTTTLGMPL